MNLKKLQFCIERYRRYLSSEEGTEGLFHWETLLHFQNNWDTEATDLASMYDAALQNYSTRRWWKGHDYHPKEVMLQFMQMEPEYVRLAFRDLFHDDKDLGGRLGRFIFYCDELLTMYREKNEHAKMNHHYHDHKIAMMYLAFRHPQKYTLYNMSAFHTFLRAVDARDIPKGHDMERFQKVTRVLHTFLGKDEGIQALLQKRLDQRHYPKETLLPVYECMMANADAPH